MNPPGILCPECDGAETFVTCAARHAGVCPCDEIEVDCETCGATGEIPDPNAPATIEEAHDLVSATLADESRADAALDKLRADFALAEKVAAARLYEAKGASSLARMHLRYLTAEKRHAQIEMGETARAAGLR